MNLIFFDGVCGLCNRFVNLLIEADKNNVLKFAPLQGKTAVELLSKEFIHELKTIVYYRNYEIFTESDAVLEILKSIGGIWAIFFRGNMENVHQYLNPLNNKINNKIFW